MERQAVDSVEDLWAQADACTEQGRWSEAVSVYKAAIALEPTHSDLYNDLGIAYEKIDNLEAAEKAYRRAIVLAPKNSTAYYNLGLLCEEQHRIPEARQALQKCLAYTHDDGERFAVEIKLARLSPEIKQEVKQTRASFEWDDIAQMYKEIRSNAIVVLFWGGISIFSGGIFDPGWGIILFVVAILSWKARVPAMFVIYGALLGWAAVTNGLTALFGEGRLWLVVAITQVFGAISMAKSFRKYNHLQLQELFQTGHWPALLAPPQDEVVISSRFAVASLILAGVTLVLLPSFCVGSAVVSVMTPSSQPLPQIDILLAGIVDMAVLALGLGCAALFSENDKKWMAISGVMMSTLVLISWLGLLLLTYFSVAGQPAIN